ncbi:spore coat protein [Anaerosolibacter sp.]|uniref:spore coat protein n=1 Tax=Anaerosolibacter sp. TaxID=1872527 RepID=UPI0039EECFF5
MASLLNSLMGTNQMDDQTIANDMLAGAKAAASAYLTATLESATPELRAMYGTSLNQIIGGHAAVTALAVKNEWYKPYDMPEQQLSETVYQSQTVIDAGEGIYQ